MICCCNVIMKIKNPKDEKAFYSQFRFQNFLLANHKFPDSVTGSLTSFQNAIKQNTGKYNATKLETTKDESQLSLEGYIP